MNKEKRHALQQSMFAFLAASVAVSLCLIFVSSWFATPLSGSNACLLGLASGAIAGLGCYFDWRRRYKERGQW
jgi:hypothetical protein